MYHPKIVAERLSKAISSIRTATDQPFDVPSRKKGDVEEMVRHIDSAYTAEKGQIRGLTNDEQSFVLQELVRAKCDALYFLTTYCKVKTKDSPEDWNLDEQTGILSTKAPKIAPSSDSIKMTHAE